MAENELRRHKIRAELYDNLLTEDPSDFIAKPRGSNLSSNTQTQGGSDD